MKILFAGIIGRAAGARTRGPGGSMKILFAGIIGRYPFGGVAWCSLMYLVGLRTIGHEDLAVP